MTKEEASKLLSGRILVSRLSKQLPEGIALDELRSLDIPPGTVIRNSCFSCERPDSAPFPEKMRGVRFIGCNLDNVVIPPGNPDLGSNDRCSQRRFSVNPIDGKDWLVDATGKATQLLSEAR
jgi:hypothetical protein